MFHGISTGLGTERRRNDAATIAPDSDFDGLRGTAGFGAMPESDGRRCGSDGACETDGRRGADADDEGVGGGWSRAAAAAAVRSAAVAVRLCCCCIANSAVSLR